MYLSHFCVPGEKLFLVSVMKIKEMIYPTYCCQLTVKEKTPSFILETRFWKIKPRDVHTRSPHHCKSKSNVKKGHTKSAKMLTLPGTLIVTGTNQGCLWNNSIKTKYVAMFS